MNSRTFAKKTLFEVGFTGVRMAVRKANFETVCSFMSSSVYNPPFNGWRLEWADQFALSSKLPVSITSFHDAFYLIVTVGINSYSVVAGKT